MQLVEGDLHRPAALRQLVSGCAGVIHAAGAVRGASQADFDRINVAGTANLLTALSSQAPGARLLMLSSLAAREPQLSWYAASKRGGESLLEKASQLDWVILRPPAVYGPGDREMLPVFQWMSRGIALVPGDPAARISLIHVSDLVVAIGSCLRSKACTHQTLALCDGTPGGYDWPEMAAIAGAVWGRKVRLWQVPAWLLDSVARINIPLMARTVKKLLPMPILGNVAAFSSSPSSEPLIIIQRRKSSLDFSASSVYQSISSKEEPASWKEVMPLLRHSCWARPMHLSHSCFFCSGLSVARNSP